MLYSLAIPLSCLISGPPDSCISASTSSVARSLPNSGLVFNLASANSRTILLPA